MKRCAIYTRKSTSIGLEQDFNSLDAQRESCEAYIRSQPGWTLVPSSYDDGGYTGANTDRPAFQRLLEDVDADRVDVIVCYKVDRLSRSLLDFAKVMDHFYRSGVDFVSVTQHFSTADPAGRLTLNLLMTFAEFEREMIAQRTRDKIAGARRRGKWTGGSIPIGYRSVDKKLTVDETRATDIQRVFDIYLEHKSLVRIMSELGGTWTKDSILRVLRNPVYAGYVRAGNDLVHAEHCAIVSKEVYDKVQSTLGRPIGQHRAGVYLLRGLVRCGSCGAGMTPGSTFKGDREYRYYRCQTQDKRGPMGCAAPALPAQAIEDFVVDKLRKLVTEGSLTTDVAERLSLRIETSRAKLLLERRQIPSQIATLASQPMSNDVADGLTKLQARLEEIEREFGALREARAEAKWVTEALQDFDGIWDILSPANRVGMVAALVDHVVVNEASGTIQAHLAELTSDIPGEATA